MKWKKIKVAFAFKLLILCWPANKEDFFLATVFWDKILFFKSASQTALLSAKYVSFRLPDECSTHLYWVQVRCGSLRRCLFSLRENVPWSSFPSATQGGCWGTGWAGELPGFTRLEITEMGFKSRSPPFTESPTAGSCRIFTLVFSFASSLKFLILTFTNST